MKLSKILLLAFLAFSMVANQSCKKNGDDDVVITDPKLEVETGSEFVTPGSIVEIAISANSDVNAELSSIEVLSKSVGSATVTELDTSISKTTFTYDLEYMVPSDAASGEKIDIEVKATDDGGRSTTEIITLTVSTPLQIIKNPHAADSTFKVWNILGQQPGAFSIHLLTNLTVNDTDDLKDMVDQTVSASEFARSWKSEDGAMYVRDNNLNFDGISSAALQASYDAGSPSDEISSIEEGDVIIVKMAEPGAGLAVVHIIQVNVTASDNNDYIGFYIKK
ncbi:MAG: hypothetical protein WD077_03860 [Bacteroidia bacterium]